ncbi:hypothetical protein H7Y63_01950 [Polaromonas sp.]|nr:hypothetical protein [Candidatus Saccharibacteria bacterium]
MIRESFRDFLAFTEVQPEAVADYLGNMLLGKTAVLQLRPISLGVFRGRSSAPSKLTGRTTTIYSGSSPSFTSSWLNRHQADPANFSLTLASNVHLDRPDAPVLYTGGGGDLQIKLDQLQQIDVGHGVITSKSHKSVFSNARYNIFEQALADGIDTAQSVRLSQPATCRGFAEPFAARLLLYRELLSCPLDA